MVESWKIFYAKKSQKDSLKIKNSGLKEKTEKLLKIIKLNPWEIPPPYEKLVGDLSGIYSRRINRQHRLLYEVFKEEKIIKVLRMWTHYE